MSQELSSPDGGDGAAGAALDDERLVSRETFANPYPIYAELRDRTPLRFRSIRGDGSMGRSAPVWSWGVMKYRDVCTVLRDHETFSSKDPLAGQLGPPLAMVSDDPPAHTRLRRVVKDSFSPAGLLAIESWIASEAARLLEAFGAEVDFVEAYAAPLPVRVIANLLGIAEEDHATFRRWSKAYISTIPLQASERMRNIREMTRYFERIAGERRGGQGHDLISTLVNADAGGQPLAGWEVLGLCQVLLIAGSETTTSLLGNVLDILVDRPELWRRMRDDRSLIGPVIEETLRLTSPIQRSAFRTATRNVQLSGVDVAAGHRVTVFYGAANHDPAIFDDPAEFRLGRVGQDHVAFGLGPHFCLGANLSRMEARITMNSLLDRFSSVSRGSSSALRQVETPVVYGFTKLPLVFG